MKRILASVGLILIALASALVLLQDTKRNTPIDRSSDVTAVKRSEKEYSKLLQQALKFKDPQSFSDFQFASRAHKAGRALIKSDQPGQAVDLAIEAASKRPCEETYNVLQTVSVDSNIKNTKEGKKSYIKGMRWLFHNGNEFGESSRFLNNLAHAEEVAGTIEDSLKIRKLIVEKYPGEEITASHIFSIVRLSTLNEDYETAKDYLDILLGGDYSERSKASARDAMESIEKQTGEIGKAPVS